MTRSVRRTSPSIASGLRRPFRDAATAVACCGLGALGLVAFPGAPAEGHEVPGLHLGATAFLGVGVRSTSSAAGGARIVQVMAGRPAARAGLSVGDVIVGLSGHAITSAATLSTVMASERPGTSVRRAYLDATGTRHTVTVHLVAGPAL